MRVGIPKEIKDNENRVAATPGVVTDLVRRGHKVLVEAGAGLGSGITNAEYAASGAELVDAATAWQADMVVKVKEPMPEEHKYFYPGQCIFTYLHLAADKELTLAMLNAKVAGVAYETIQLENGTLPLLAPMSEVAGRMAVQEGARFLEKSVGGRGILMGGVPGVPPAEVVIIGAGTVGAGAAKIALGMGANVTLLDTNIERLRFLADVYHGHLVTLASNSHNIATAVKSADLLIGAVLVPGARAPHLVTEAMIASMNPGAVVVDVAVDQGGCIETVDHATTHSDPVYIKHGIIHYAVANMPGAVARTSTYALTNATHPYILQLADNGTAAIKAQAPLAKGVNVIGGALVYEAVAKAHGLPYVPLAQVLG